MNRRQIRARMRHAGQASTEFLLAFPVVVLMVFGIIQLGLLYQGRATLNHATLQAARAGALHNGNLGAMRNALARGLAPLFAGSADTAGYAEALTQATIETAAASNMTKIEILNPTSAVFDDFGRPRIDGVSGDELPNDTLAYRKSTAGASSNLSIQDANLLHIRVTYCYRLIVPVIDRMLHAATNGSLSEATGMSNPFGIGSKPLVAKCTNPLLLGLRIHVRSEAIVRMQSPFYKVNVGGAGVPGSPSDPADPGVPPDPSDPETPVDPMDPTDPTDPVDPGVPPCL